MAFAISRAVRRALVVQQGSLLRRTAQRAPFADAPWRTSCSVLPRGRDHSVPWLRARPLFFHSTAPSGQDSSSLESQPKAGATTMEHNFIVGGKKTVKRHEMPFVNRLEELWQLFRVNAANTCVIGEQNWQMNDFRDVNLLFCVQYFGSGKTTLGEVFPSKVRDAEVQAFFEKKLENEGDPLLRDEWELMKKDGIKRVSIDVGSAPDIILKAAIVASGNKHVEIRDSPEVAADHLIDYAVKNGPTLFHFDEVGSDKKHDIHKLRQLARAVWMKMWEKKSKDGLAAMPRIYFLVTGKAISPFEGIGTGMPGSPTGSYFLVLDMLTAAHVGDVRRHLQGVEAVAGCALPKHPLVLNGLDEEADGAELHKCLKDATGGAPRLLLYTLRALHFSQAPLSSPELIREAVFGTAFNMLDDIPVISREFLPEGIGECSSVVGAFKLLLGLTMHQTQLKMSTLVEVGGAKREIGYLLRSQAFLLSRDGCDSKHFVLRLPRFHLMAVEKLLGDAFPVPQLLISMAGGTMTANDTWRVFEVLPAHVIAAKAWHDQLLPKKVMLSWAEAFPSLLGRSVLAKQTQFHLGHRPFTIHNETGKCPSVIEDNPEFYATAGGCVVPRDKSASSDLYHLQRRLDSTGVVVCEWQAKQFFASKLGMSHVRDEVSKSVKKLDSLMILYSASVGEQLVDAMQDRVLILPSWDSATAAVFAFCKAGLLWRPSSVADAGYMNGFSSDCGGNRLETRAKKDAKSAFDNRQQPEAWCKFPDKEPGDLKPVAGKAVVKVRSGLEVVIPHHDLIRELLGVEVFDWMLSLHKKDSPVVVQSLITTLDDIMDRSTGGGTTAASADGDKLQEAKLEKAKVELKEAKAELEKAEAKLEKAQAKLEKAKAELEKAKASGDPDDIALAKEGVASAQAGVTSAQVGVTSAQNLVSRLTEVSNDTNAVGFKAIKGLPPLYDPASEERHVFISLENTAAQIDGLFEGERALFIRAGVATGKSTLAIYLVDRFPNFIMVPTAADTEAEWHNNIIKLVPSVNNDGDVWVAFSEALEALAGKTLVIDEAHALFSFANVCERLFKTQPADKCPRFLLFSAAARGERQHGKPKYTPPGIKKVMWYPPPPMPDELSAALEEAGVLLDADSVDLFLKLAAGHRGIFMAAMRWVKQLQAGASTPGPWDLSTSMTNVRGGMNASWEGSFQEALTESRAVKANDRYSDLRNLPLSFLKILAGGAATSLDPSERRSLTINGLLQPQHPQPRHPGDSTDEFVKLDWDFNKPFGIPNPLMADFYLTQLSDSKDVLFKRGLRKGMAVPRSCADLLARALPLMPYIKVVDASAAERSKKSDLPHEPHYSRTCATVLNDLGCFDEVRQPEGPKEGKVDLEVTAQDGKKFAVEFIMMTRRHDAHTEHRDRFDRPDLPNYYGADFKCLAIIGDDEAKVCERVKSTRGGGGVEIIGLVVSPAHEAYTMFVKSSHAQGFDGPYRFDCDGVAKALHPPPPRGGKGGALQVVSAHKLTSPTAASMKKTAAQKAEAKAELEKAEAKLEKAKTELEKAKAELEKAEAKLEKAQAKLEKAKASGDQDDIARAERAFARAEAGAASAQEGVTSAQSLVSRLTDAL